MIEVTIDSVRVNLMSPHRLVILREVGADRYLPIWVGAYEAESITVALQEVEMIRPLTHDLLKSVFTTFNAKIKRIEIISLKEDIFYGNIVAEVNGTDINVDSRPSDALALAVRAHVPILVDESVMQSAGITPEADMQTSTGTAAQSPTATRSAPAPEVSSERLSVFEDFLGKLDLDKLDDKDKDKPSDEDKPDKPDKSDKPKRPKKK
ncbi:MAG TPA: bifunctional nuclease family protein [Anaerolineales bacterium]|jgi:bifunctional DNase/RNase|nr:bifunctional nuclease family protein [Anaerolineales bacterium]